MEDRRYLAQTHRAPLSETPFNGEAKLNRFSIDGKPKRKPPPDLDYSNPQFDDIINDLDSEINRFSMNDEYDYDYNMDSDLSPSLVKGETFGETFEAPYPVGSPIAPSPTSLTYNEAYVTPNAIYEQDESLNYENTGIPPLRPSITAPITNSSQIDPRNSERSSLFNSSSSNMLANVPTNTTNTFRNHRKSSSLSSIWSSNSSKNVNLASLKKTLDLRPGEGDRSKYVSALRKSSGTAYNDTPPGKWKLPLGIAPVDKRATYTTSNSRYMRLVGGVSQSKARKGVGVELKHGHLAPRLLAAEVDDGDDHSIKFREGASTPTNKSSRSSLLMNPETPSVTSKNSLSRTITETSTTSGAILSKSDVSSRKSSVSSSGSIQDMANGGFYQHPQYRDTEEGPLDEVDEPVEYKEGTLFLANPDTDSD